MYGKKMRRIKLFESFEGGITEQEIRGALLELQDVGYDVLITKTYTGYSVSISAGDEFFDIKNVSEPILELIDYLTEKYGGRFVYSIEYNDYTTEDHEIEDLEQFVKDNPLEDTDELKIELVLK
jgi:hypothetical protein